MKTIKNLILSYRQKFKSLDKKKKYGIIFFLLLVNITLSNLTYQNYKKHVAYKAIEDNKNDAIFQIITVNGGSCTAFAVSDTLAVTASHCVQTTTKELDNTMAALPEIRAKLIELENYPTFNYKQDKIKLERVKKVKDSIALLLTIKPDVMIVLTNQGQDVGVRATAVQRLGSKGRDIAVLQGNFKDFKHLPIKTRTNGLHSRDIYKICGMPNGTLPYVCTEFKAVGTFGFKYRGYGNTMPGMSGGPVLDYDGVVVGVYAGVNSNMTIITTTLGLF